MQRRGILDQPFSTWFAAAVPALAAFFAVGTASRVAEAQAGYFYLDRVQYSGAPDDGFVVFRPYVPEEGRFYASAALGYSHNPLRVDTVTDDALAASRIDNPVGGQLILYTALGAQFARIITASVSLPVLLHARMGDDPLVEDVGSGGIGDATTAAHDVRLDARVRTFESRDGRARFGGGAAVWIQSGDSVAFAGDGKPHGWLYGSAEFDFGNFLLAGHVGPHFRTDRSIGGSNGRLFVGSELVWAFGAYVPLRSGRVRLGGELFGSTGLSSAAGPDGVNTVFGARNTALEWLGQLRWMLCEYEGPYVDVGGGTRLSTGYGAPDFRVLVAAGGQLGLATKVVAEDKPKRPIVPDARDYDVDADHDGYPDAADLCPALPEDGRRPLPSDGCPENADRDGDGLRDADDRCATVPEDRDGIDDADGCPETDFDRDTIPDAKDGCPDKFGIPSEKKEKHGCPSEDPDRDGVLSPADQCPTDAGPRSDNPNRSGCPGFTRVTDDGELKLLEPLQFETGKGVLKRVSYPILDEVVAQLKGRLDRRLGIYGHTDDRGPAELNRRLSKARAAACVKYLVDNGVYRDQLEYDGYGPDRPIADNGTDEGRAQNRRIQMVFLPPQTVPPATETPAAPATPEPAPTPKPK